MSISADTLRKLAALKLDPDQMAGVLDVLADIQSADEDRKAKQRERVQRHRAKHNSNVTETLQECYTPPSDKEKSPTPPKEINTPPETKRASRLPDDWVLPASWGNWALSEGYSEATIRLEASKFSDFWQAKGGKDAKKLDWEKTWRNWMRNVPKSRGSPLSQAPPRETEFARHQRECRETIQRKLNGHDDDDFAGPAFDLEPGNYSAH
jgi:hypothetical protein